MRPPEGLGDGGPAHPVTWQNKTANTVLIDDQLVPHGAEVVAMGVTVLDWFASDAMRAILGKLDHGIRPSDVDKMCEDAYVIAEAMMKARRARRHRGAQA